MNELQLELTRLIGKKELTRGVILENEWAGDNNPSRFFVFTHKADGHHKGFFEYNGKTRQCAIPDDKEAKTNIIGHPATLSDFHRWMRENGLQFRQGWKWIDYSNELTVERPDDYESIPYDSFKDLLEQSDYTLKQIIELIKNSL